MSLCKTIIILLLSFTSPSQAHAGSSTHGGDGIKLTFARAKLTAAAMVRQYRPVPYVTRAEEDNWLLANGKELADDILHSKHLWTEKRLEHDAITTLNRNADIHLSLPLCRLAYGNAELATALLIHESVHHMGEQNEALADSIAAAVAMSYRVQNPDNIRAAKIVPLKMPANIQSIESRQMAFDGEMAAAIWTDDGGYLLNVITGTWQAFVKQGAPDLIDSSMVFDGTRFVIWGGRHQRQFGIGVDVRSVPFTNAGFAYDPMTKIWKPLNSIGAPSPRAQPHAFKTKYGFLVWGGTNEALGRGNPNSRLMGLKDGGVYDSRKNAWSPIPTLPFPCDGRADVDYLEPAEGEKLGYLMVVCSRPQQVTGAIYDVNRTTWQEIPDTSVTKTKYHDARDHGWSQWADTYSAGWYKDQIVLLGTNKDGSSRLALFDPKAWAWEDRMAQGNLFESSYAPSKGSYRVHSDGNRLYFFNGMGGRFLAHQAELDMVNRLSPKDRWHIIDAQNSLDSAQPTNTFFRTCGWTGEALVCLSPSKRDDGSFILRP